MISLGPLIPLGEPVTPGTWGLALPLRPLPAWEGCPPPRMSDIEAFSSSKSGVNGLGWRRASSRAYRIALPRFLEIRSARWGRRAGSGESYGRLGANGVEVPFSSSKSFVSWGRCLGPADGTLLRGGEIPAEAASIWVLRSCWRCLGGVTGSLTS